MPACLPISIPPTKDHICDIPVLDARLSAAAALCRDGARIADVGTDHAYLPIVLLRQGKCTFAVATDIHRKPAEIAAAHLSQNGIWHDRAAVLCTDGLHGAQKFHPTDVFILGMGGEMISRIIDEAPWLRHPDIRLILQPMTRMEMLRQYLAQSGFVITNEQLAKTDRIYQIICAEYDGTVHAFTPLEYLLGKQNMERRDELCLTLAARQRDILAAARAGKQQGNAPDTAREDELIEALDRFLSEVDS